MTHLINYSAADAKCSAAAIDRIDAIDELRRILRADLRRPTITFVLLHVGTSRNGYPHRTWMFLASDYTPEGTIHNISRPLAFALSRAGTVVRDRRAVRTQDDPAHLISELSRVLYDDTDRLGRWSL